MLEEKLYLDKEPVILVGIQFDGTSKEESEEHLKELSRLADTAGAEVCHQVLQQRRAPDPAYFIGKGKAESLFAMCDMYECDTVIFDDDLSPGQVKNLEKILDCKVIDRSGLILDIFARHARTRESKTQVELAQLRYILPRLTRMWTHLSRQVGGIGVRGPGETQLEVDKRLIQKKIEKLEKDLKQIEKQRINRRKQRKEAFRVALVGYTNAGKSSLMNSLTQASVLTEDKLFATLDSTVRKLSMSGKRNVLLSDTVGFIRKLPHHLVAAFRGTLGEVRESDLLLHIIDASHPQAVEQVTAVNHVLKSLKLEKKIIIPVLNKVDIIKKGEVFNRIIEKFPKGVFTSAVTGHGIPELINTIDTKILEFFEEQSIFLPAGESHKIYEIDRLGEILKTETSENGIEVHFRIRKDKISRLEKAMMPLGKAIAPLGKAIAPDEVMAD